MQTKPCPNANCEGGLVDSGGTTPLGEWINVPCTWCNGKGEVPDEPYFTCPDCGGHHFGRVTAASKDGETIVTSKVSCHDQHRVNCRWVGEWPDEGNRRSNDNQ